MKMHISHVNQTEGYIYSQYTETLDPDERVGLFRRLSREFGRCVSKCYVGDGKQVGWVFEKKVEYDRSRHSYMMETWVELIEERCVDLREAA
jgi:hypothetical protein